MIHCEKSVVRRLRLCAGALMLALWAACGGGSMPDPLAGPLDFAKAVYQPELLAQLQSPGQNLQREAALAAPTPTATQFMNWAETALPTYFPPTQSDVSVAGSTAAAGSFVYRYYPATGNTVLVWNDQVFVIGAISAGRLVNVGTLALFANSVFPQTTAVVATTTTATTTTPPAASTTYTNIRDSFGDLVPVADTSGVGAGDAGADGSAGDGAPIVGGTVTIVDLRGNVATAVTDARGYYRAKISGFAPPMVLTVLRRDGGPPRRSVYTGGVTYNAFTNVNITSLTDKIASDLAVQANRASVASLSPADVNAKKGYILASVMSLRVQLNPVITKASLDVNSFDPISVPFRTNGTGYDYVLDNTVATATSTSGGGTVTALTVNSGFVTVNSSPPTQTVNLYLAYAGTYDLSILGADTGAAVAQIDATGKLTASGRTTLGSVSGTGSVTTSGSATVSIGVGGVTAGGATFTGSITPDGVFSGRWSNSTSGLSGTCPGQRRV